MIDYDAAIRDPLIPDRIALKYDALDNLQPNRVGYQKMADSIPQAILGRLAKG